MGKYPDVKCRHCGRRFETQIRIDPAIYAMAPNIKIGRNTFTCPHCNTKGDYSENDFLYTRAQVNELRRFGKIVSDIADVVMASGAPLATATALLAELEAARVNPSLLSQSPTWHFIKVWLPNTPEKLAAWIVILQVIKSLLTNDHEQKIDHASLLITLQPTIQMLVIEQTTPAAPAHKVAPKPKRNSPCHCGSGKKYKHCHGRIER
jgi:hypothetical protein